MKKHNILKVLLITILIVTLCTWLIPSATFQTELAEGDRIQVGLFDLFSYPMVALSYFLNVAFYVLAVGMFYGVANKIAAYKVLQERIANGFKGKEHFFIALAVILIATIVSVTGLSFAIIFVFPFVISIILMLGYNKLVAATTTVGGAIAGIAGTTLGYNAVSYINQILAIDVFSEILCKVIILVLFIILLIANILMYAKKTMNNLEKVEVKRKEIVEAEVTSEKATSEIKVTKSTKKESSKKVTNSATNTTSKTTTKKKPAKKKTKASMAKKSYEEMKVKNKDKKPFIWPFVIIFDLVLIIIGLSIFNWTGLYEIDLFGEVTTSIQEFKINGFPIFSKILGTFSAFGAWTMNVEIPALILMATLVMALIYRVKFDDFFDGIKEGIRKAAEPALIMVFTYIVLVIVTYHPFQLVFTKLLLGFSDGLNVVTMTIIAFISSIFNVDSTYVAQSTLPYVISVISDTKLYPLIAVIFQSIYGLAMLVAPTSIILLGTLTYLEIPYKEWLKHIWKVFLQLLVVLLIIFLLVLVI